MNEAVSSLLQFLQAGGILMPILAAVSCGIWYLSLSLYIPLLLAFRRLRALSDCTSHIPTTETSPITSACPGDEMTGYRISQLRPFEQRLGILRALVVCAPLLGLLGTVKGMITTFVALGERGVASMDMLSVGISEALITTQVGLIIAIPGLVGSHATARLITQMKNALDRLGIHQAKCHEAGQPETLS